MPTSEKVTCFIVAPIGDDGSATRKRSDIVLKYVIRPVLSECGYEAVRADHISEPGLINSQVIQHIVEDPLVIIDLTDKNPNVFYELAIRHAVRKACVQMIEKGQQLPFDVAGTRTIQLDHRDLESVDVAKQELLQQIRSLRESSSEIETPISFAIDLNFLTRSADPRQAALADLTQKVTGIQRFIDGVQDLLARERRALYVDISQQLSALSQKINDRFADSLGTGGDDLSSITETIDRIEKRTNKAIGEIQGDIEKEFTQLAKDIEHEFTLQSCNIKDMLHDIFAEYVHKFTPEGSQQEQLLGALVSAFSDAMVTMGQYQRMNIEARTSENASRLGSRILSSIKMVLDDVGELRDAVLTPLPAPPEDGP